MQIFITPSNLSRCCEKATAGQFVGGQSLNNHAQRGFRHRLLFDIVWIGDVERAGTELTNSTLENVDFAETLLSTA
jgi:hypothetical protein